METDTPSSTTKQGFIRKEAPTVFGRSHRRWFVLDADACTLRYYEDEAKAAAHARDPREPGPRGEIGRKWGCLLRTCPPRRICPGFWVYV